MNVKPAWPSTKRWKTRQRACAWTCRSSTYKSLVDDWMDLEWVAGMYRVLVAVPDRRQHAKSSYQIEYSTRSQYSVHERRAVNENYYPTHTRSYLVPRATNVGQRWLGSSLLPATAFVPSRNSDWIDDLYTSQIKIVPLESALASFKLYGSSKLW